MGMNQSRWLFSFIVLIIFVGCKEDTTITANLNQSAYLHQSMSKLTDIIVHDIFSPPAASRVYVYPSIAAYEILQQENDGYASLAGQLHDLTPIPKPNANNVISLELAAIHAFTTIGKALIFSEGKMVEYQNELYAEMKEAGISQGVFLRSIAYGEKVADHILQWADQDNYKQTRTFPKYSFTDDPGKWQPTPPGYMQGIEPHWREIRTFVIDSSNQFIPAPPVPFNMKPGTDFYNLTMEVYETVNTNDDERVEIASFWDCNPYVAHQTGHVMYATKKITPGGHWIGITEIACKKSNADLMKSASAYALTSISLADAFISCWDEKYRSNLVRPETVINEYIDTDWQPTLQTPPFPEHTSGHSVISTAAAIALTSIFGDDFSFTDDVEVKYGLPERRFNSFIEASGEAAISRLYGGIHYMPAITDGVDQGKKVGILITGRLTLGK
jgi:hypothetical protein